MLACLNRRVSPHSLKLHRLLNSMSTTSRLASLLRFSSLCPLTTDGGDSATARVAREHRGDSFIRSFRRYISDKSRTPDEEAALRQKELMSRTRIVTDEVESASIVDHIFSLGHPIAVDMEGVSLPTLGMVQVKTTEGKIFLFRTGRNPLLLQKGGLKTLLEDPNILKVMHASTGDALAVYKEGVRMWGLYDTAVAHKVIQYQTEGESLTTNTIGFNDMCDHYGVRSNPMKHVMAGTMWKRQNALLEQDTLPVDLVYYSACDVEPLLDLYEITRSIIEPDFHVLFQDMCENELIRAIDLELLNVKQRTRVRVQGANVFLSNFSPEVRKVHVYEAVAMHEGYKKVHFCEAYRTAHILMSNRASAILVYKALTQAGLPEVFGPQTKVQLVADLKADEIEDTALEYGKYLDRLKEENYIVDHNMSADIVDRLLQAKSPVVLDFHLHPNTLVTLEMFVGRYPPLKFNLSHDSVTKGKLGDLMAADSVTKVIGRIDSNNVYSALKVCSATNFRAKNFFEINTAYKMIDYWLYGQSIYKTTSPNQREIMQKFGLNATPSNRLENLLYVYLHLKQMLPVELLEFLSAKGQVDLDIGGQVCFAEAKEARKQLRLRMEINVFHVVCERGRVSDMKEVLQRFLTQHDMPYNRIICAGKCALVEMQHHGDIFPTIGKLQARNVDGLVLTASDVDLKAVIEKKPLQQINAKRLDKLNMSYVEDLDNLGFFEIMQKPQEIPKHANKTFSSLNLEEFKTLFR